MRAFGLAFLLFGSLAFAFLGYRRVVDYLIILSATDCDWGGGLLVAFGAATLFIYRSREG